MKPIAVEGRSLSESRESDSPPTKSHLAQVLRVFGIILFLGGVGHSVGVIRFYVREGVPGANRVLLDLWIAEAQMIGGALYLQASRLLRARAPWRTVAVFGAFTVISYAGPFIPVLVFRAPIVFWIAPSIYVLVSLFILTRAALNSCRPR